MAEVGWESSSPDARYVQGLAHLQAGKWQEAIQCLGSLLQEQPDDAQVRRALEDAHFKAHLDATTRVRPKRWLVPWRAIAVRVLLAVVLAFLAVWGWGFYRNTFLPRLEQWSAQRQLDRLKKEAAKLLEADKLDEAETKYQQVLARRPDDADALAAETKIAAARELLGLYQQGVAAQEAGNLDAALAVFTDLLLRQSPYQDVSQRIERIQKEQKLEQLFARAEATFLDGRASEALALFEELRAQNSVYQAGAVGTRLYTLHMQLGRNLLAQQPPAAEVVPQARDHFAAALQLRPRDTEAALERQLADDFQAADGPYRAQEWARAIQALRKVYDQRPGYLSGLVAAMLYETYVAYGDGFAAAEPPDCAMAFEQYNQARNLAVEDTTLAERRISDVLACIPPTPTPTFTPTPSPTRPPTQVPSPVPPTRTPTPAPLEPLRGKILFMSDNPKQPGVWVMDPTGENRRYLGTWGAYKARYEALRAKEAFAPDGKTYAFVGRGAKSAQIFIFLPRSEQWGQLPPKQLTFLTGISYDPVWSPDSSRIAFVSQENEGDDIWVINSDGTDIHWLTRNTWEWDKHPSWSPDGQRIAFWSNRNGLKQIYVMDAEGRSPVNISQSQWDEYDPLWVK